MPDANAAFTARVRRIRTSSLVCAVPGRPGLPPQSFSCMIRGAGGARVHRASERGVRGRVGVRGRAAESRGCAFVRSCLCASGLGRHHGSHCVGLPVDGPHVR